MREFVEHLTGEAAFSTGRDWDWIFKCISELALARSYGRLAPRFIATTTGASASTIVRAIGWSHRMAAPCTCIVDLCATPRRLAKRCRQG